jgi:hypothetical protein
MKVAARIGEAMSVDIGSVAEGVAAGLGVLASWLALRSQVRQGERHVRAVEDLIEAMHVGGRRVGSAPTDSQSEAWTCRTAKR